MSPVISLQTEIILTHGGFHHHFFNPQGLLGEAGPPGPKGGKGIEVTKHVTHKNTLTHSHLDFGNLFLITDQNNDGPASQRPLSAGSTRQDQSVRNSPKCHVAAVVSLFHHVLSFIFIFSLMSDSVLLVSRVPLVTKANWVLRDQTDRRCGTSTNGHYSSYYYYDHYYFYWPHWKLLHGSTADSVPVSPAGSDWSSGASG